MKPGESTATDGGSSQSKIDSAREAAIKAVRAKSGELGKAATGKIEKVASDGKETLAGRVGRVAAALRAAAEAMQEQEPQIASYPMRLAGQLEQFSNHLSERDVRALVADFEQIARRRPEVFVGGALVAGLVVGRFLRASSPGAVTGDFAGGSGIQTYRRSYQGTAGAAGTESSGSGTSKKGRSNMTEKNGGKTGMNYSSDRDYSDAGHESDFNADGSVKGKRNERNSGDTSAGKSGGGPDASGGGNTLDPTKVPTKVHGDPLSK